MWVGQGLLQTARLIFIGSETLAQESSCQAKLAVGREPHAALIQPVSHGQHFHQWQNRSFFNDSINRLLARSDTHTASCSAYSCSVQEYSSYAQ